MVGEADVELVNEELFVSGVLYFTIGFFTFHLNYIYIIHLKKKGKTR